MSRRKRREQKLSIQRRRSSNQRRQKASNLKALAEWLIPTGGLFPKSRLHGNTKWTPENLAIQAVIWSWQEARYVTDAFSAAVGVCNDLKLMHVAQTYTAFLNALERYADEFGPALRRLLQTLMEEVAGRFWRTDGWAPIAFDGSRTTAPRTASNERAFCAPNYGKGKTARYRKKKSKGMRRRKNERNKPQPQAPQVWITMLWHMSLRLPWTWRLGPSNSSEREHVKQILNEEKIPKNTLLCGDAGFVGYELWKAILEAQAAFVIRVGANVSLLSMHADFRQLKDGEVLCWPKGKMASGERPLRLRLVRVKIGKTRMWMLTNVRERNKLTTKQIIQFYQMRWGIEVEFRGLKQTLDKHNLRCRNSSRVYVELDWSIRAMAFAELLALREQLPQGKRTQARAAKSSSPQDRSLAETMRALRAAMHAPRGDADTELLLKLAQARVKRYRNGTDKKSRYRPSNPDKKPLGNPKIRRLNRAEIDKMRELDRRSLAA
jgi:Transposase DDE domain